MSTIKKVLSLTLLAGLLFALNAGQALLSTPVSAANNSQTVPSFEVDPFWPQPLPNKWILGRAIGVDVDERDHVFIVHRDSDDMFMSQELGLDLGNSQCCTAAPPILEFDAEGNLVSSWGGISQSGEYEWPASNHGIEIAANGNVWIGGNGSGDSHVLVFTRDGEYIRTVGEPGNGRDSNSTTHFARVAEIAIDRTGTEAYLADGYVNRRVAVVDVATGALKRYWGAYGNRPDDEADNSYVPGQTLPQQFKGPVHCAEPSNDDLIYVCDRGGDRIQVFRADGTFVKEAMIAPETLAMGSTWDIAFSQDDDQEFIYVADGSNMKVHILARDSLEVLYTFGEGGRQPGMFFSPHSIATDSDGNIYTTETYEGKRVQKFLYKGRVPLRSVREGVAWPASDIN
jgi:hypothetical protein